METDVVAVTYVPIFPIAMVAVILVGLLVSIFGDRISQKDVSNFSLLLLLNFPLHIDELNLRVDANNQKLEEISAIFDRASKEQEAAAARFRQMADQAADDDEKMFQLNQAEAREECLYSEKKRKMQDEMNKVIKKQIDINRLLEEAVRTKNLDKILQIISPK